MALRGFCIWTLHFFPTMEVNETRNCLVTDILLNIKKSAEWAYFQKKLIVRPLFPQNKLETSINWKLHTLVYGPILTINYEFASINS